MPFRSYRSLLFKFLTFGVLEPPFGGLETTYDVHFGLIGKRVADFLLVLFELFFARSYGLRATNENRSKIGDFAPTRSL